MAPDPATGEVRLAMGRLLYEWDDLDGAERWLTEGTRQAEAAGMHHSVVDGQLATSRLRWARGDPEGALALARDAGRLAEWAGANLSAVDAAAWTARLQLAEGDSEAARRDFDRATAGGVPRAASETAGLATARLLLAEDRPAEALQILDAVRAAAEGAGRPSGGVEALTLQALARWAAGEPRPAVETIGQALELAEPEGYVRTFVDEGPALDEILRAALEARQRVAPEASRSVSTPYLRKLLAARERRPEAGIPHPGPAGQPGALIEPLTEREREVLVLVAAGKSTRQIADELVVTEGTVKTHLTHVYRKLDAHSRTQALANARELALL